MLGIHETSSAADETWDLVLRHFGQKSSFTSLRSYVGRGDAGDLRDVAVGG